MIKKFFYLLLSIALPLSIGFAGSIAVMPMIAGWYAGLLKPALNPPAFVFGPVWTLLYVLMGIAAYRIFRKRDQKGAIPALILYGVHLIVNFAWSFVFFGSQSVIGGVAVIAVLWIMIVALVVLFFRIDRTAGYLLLPYLAWVSFAAYLNVSIALLN